MKNTNTAVPVRYDMSPSEGKALLAFLEDKADEFQMMSAHGPITVEMQPGKSISIFTYDDFLDCLAQLRAGETSIEV